MENRNYVFWLIGICVIIFILQSFIPYINDNFTLVSSRVLNEPWMLITSMFLHGDLVHLLNNMLALFIFGMILENSIGSKRFLIVYFVSGVFAGLIASFFYNAALGASGAIFGVLGTLVMLKPKMVVYVYFMPLPMYLAGILWALIDISRFFFPTGIASAAHLAGLFIGLGFGYYFKKKFGDKYFDDELNIVEHWEK
ncbi:rhomboid family intramembrane serine protease [Candidatus Woesearchaeota archaeon]|nr:rhomboid family intramembrane serine protease [Candidatus Woesearchaeota archaeon]